MKLPELDRPKGVVIRCPYKHQLLNKIVYVYISRYERRPDAIITGCKQIKYQIADLTGVMKSSGLIFTYLTNLDNGFYRIEIESEGLRGEGIYPILHNETSLIIGLPYSTYPSVDLG